MEEEEKKERERDGVCGWIYLMKYERACTYKRGKSVCLRKREREKCVFEKEREKSVCLRKRSRE